VASIVAHIVESDRLIEKSRRNRQHERVHELLLLLVPIVSSSMPFQEKMADVERIFQDGLPLSAARIWLRKGDEGFPATNPDGFKLDRQSGPLGKFMFGDEHFFWTNDYFNDPQIDPNSKEATHYKASIARSESYQPDQPIPQAYVRIRSGEQTLGVLVCAPKAGAEFSANDEWWLIHVAGMLALVIENHRLAEQSGELR
jgi:hypothetical protein